MALIGDGMLVCAGMFLVTLRDDGNFADLSLLRRVRTQLENNLHSFAAVDGVPRVLHRDHIHYRHPA